MIEKKGSVLILFHPSKRTNQESVSSRSSMWASFIFIPLYSSAHPRPPFPAVLGVCRRPASSQERLTHKRAQSCPISQSIRPRKFFEAGENGGKPFRMDALTRSDNHSLLLEGPGHISKGSVHEGLSENWDSLATGLHP